MPYPILNHYYKIYGLNLVTNVPLLDIKQFYFDTNEEVDICVKFGSFPEDILDALKGKKLKHYVSPWKNDSQIPRLTVDILEQENFFYFQYDTGARFVINNKTTRIWCDFPESLHIKLVELYFLGTILGFSLRCRGITCLHASCIELDGKAFALLGQSGAGKSTTAAAFANMGMPVLSDDILPIYRDEIYFLSVPGYPFLRLWPESAEAICGKEDALPFLAPDFDKRYLDISSQDYIFRQDPIPLKAIYFLEERSDAESAPYIEMLSKRKSLILLSANTYRNELLDKTMRQQEFLFLSKLVLEISIKSVTPSSDIGNLSSLCKIIIEDFQNMD